jgi:hypothetical protein
MQNLIFAFIGKKASCKSATPNVLQNVTELSLNDVIIKKFYSKKLGLILIFILTMVYIVSPTFLRF